MAQFSLGDAIMLDAIHLRIVKKGSLISVHLYAVQLTVV